MRFFQISEFGKLGSMGSRKELDKVILWFLWKAAYKNKNAPREAKLQIILLFSEAFLYAV